MKNLFSLLSLLFLLTLSGVGSELRAQADEALTGTEITALPSDAPAPAGITLTFESNDELKAFLATPATPAGTITEQVAIPQPAYAMQLAPEDGPDEPDESPEKLTVWEFVKRYWEEIVFALILFIEVIVNLTPTTVDDAGFRWLRRIFNAIIPNRSKTSGVRHPVK
jgi:hypothetical protein